MHVVRKTSPSAASLMTHILTLSTGGAIGRPNSDSFACQVYEATAIRTFTGLECPGRAFESARRYTKGRTIPQLLMKRVAGFDYA
jgi:hypothetical protein